MTEDVPGYRVLEQVGEGGFSIVYRAHQERLDRMVALKVLSISAVDDAAMRRFQRECKITGRLSGHPNIVTVLDTGTAKSGRPYIAMEYFEHGALTDRLAREGPLPVAEVLRIGVKMAGALAATHETDVLHRDVKPQNVLVSRYGEPALADFGIARLVDSFDATHTQAFTPHHAAPEVLEGKPPGVASDIYSLGSTLYQLLAGRPAFKGPPGEGIAPLMLRILNDPPPRIPRQDVPAPVADVIGRAMAKASEQRYGGAVEFAQALQQVQAGLGLPVTDVAASGVSVLPHPTGSQSALPLQDSSAGPPPAPRLSFPEHSGPPPVPDWAPTTPSSARRPEGPAAGALAPAPPSPWHPDAASEPQQQAPQQTPRQAPRQAPQGRERPALQAAWPVGASQDATDPSHNGGATTPHTAPHTAPAPPPGPPDVPAGPPQDGPRRGLVIAAAVALVGGAVLGVGALVLSRGGGDADPPGPNETSRTPAAPGQQGDGEAPPTAAQKAAARPRHLTARPVGRTAVLSWALPPAARGLPLLVQRQPAGSSPVQTAKPDSLSFTVPGLRPKALSCFRVGAVLQLPQGKAAEVAWSAPACVHNKARPAS
ncbi:serine/threonine-protein kinase [Actinomadura violacea]|uniref:non-specific serine/threonine protein kinase n=1 Tax=Actinomadura violacea TaxID=2819934 RepID=A0ABS3RKY6_9ACTN|nr:serine/threonine-protein kinase [Actinomadura violacea]MBO2457396.1 protein kinase [Actinomadura violacea]